MTRKALDTPMMRQFLAIKAEQPDAIVFYRMGDFYEMFLADAELAAPLLDLTLTTRDRGKPDAVPMCGIPVHSAQQYVQRLAELGHRVAICEQVEDPKESGRRLVRREVVEVVTPGLVGDPEGLVAEREVSLAALIEDEEGRAFGLAAFDATTGSFRATTIESREGEGPLHRLLEELERVAPREVAVAAGSLDRIRTAVGDRLATTTWTEVDPDDFATEALPVSPDGLDEGARDVASAAAAAVVRFVARNQPFALRYVARLRRYALHETMILDAATRAHLELFESAEDRSRKGTLIERIDRSATPLGAREIARWLRYPLLDRGHIEERQAQVAELFDQDRRRTALRAALAPVRDLERIFAKAARPTATPRDLGSLRSSLAALPGVVEALKTPGDSVALDTTLESPEALTDVAGLLEEGLIADPPVVPRGSRGALETGYIREGFRSELDALREQARKGREWITGLEAAERERTGIANLKVRFHPVHGYGLEVSKSQLDRVPEDYERKQTLANAERFTTPALREAEGGVRGAQERAAALEREVFEQLRERVIEASERVLDAARSVAQLDAVAALAELAREDAWVRPELDDGETLEIRAGRHPVVERLLRARGSEDFVPNDTELGGTRMLLLTGPNMSGKSTYLRQVAIIVLLAQIGSFVPAEAARLGIVDRVFTRVGASDRLSKGESTFMVEMRETADILADASSRSLLILDEIGRGTSTYDGLAIAWAVAEYLHDTPGLCPRTLFATHYHELAELAESRERLANVHFQVREWGDEVVFLRRLVPGEASRSYGIQVAKLAGLPEAVVRRARERLEELQRSVPEGPVSPQLKLFGPSDPSADAVLERLRGIDPDHTSPMEALVFLEELVRALGRDEP